MVILLIRYSRVVVIVIFFFCLNSFSKKTLRKVSHPRLLLNNTVISQLKEKISTKVSPFSPFFENVKKKVDDWCENQHVPTPQEFYKEANSTADAVRKYGTMCPNIALVFLIKNEQKYLTCVKKWLNAFVSYKYWDTDCSISTAHILFGFSLSFDWCYDHFSKEEQGNYNEKIHYHLKLYYEIGPSQWWWTSFTQNHNHVNFMGIASAMYCLNGTIEEEEYQKYYKAVNNEIENVLTYLPDDGSAVGGLSYFSYSLMALLEIFLLEKSFTYKLDLRLLNSKFFQNAGWFRLYASSNDFQNILQIADSQFISQDHPRILVGLFGLASAFKNSIFQWLADYISRKIEYDFGVYGFMILLNYDENVKLEQPPTDMELENFFDDIQLYVSRNSWYRKIDSKYTVFFFKSGPPFGKLADVHFNIGLGDPHAHPDEGGFGLEYMGHSLIVDDGYNHFKTSKAHNVLTFGDKGQYGENAEWFNIYQYVIEKGYSQILFQDTNSKIEYLVGDLTRIYPLDLGINKYYRHIFFVLKKYVIVFDVLELEKRQNITFNLHSKNDGYFKRGNPNEVIFRTNHESGNVGYKLWSNYNQFKFENFSYPNDDSSKINYNNLLRIVHESELSEKIIFQVVILPFEGDHIPKTPRVKNLKNNIMEVKLKEITFRVCLDTFELNPKHKFNVERMVYLIVIVILSLVILLLIGIILIIAICLVVRIFLWKGGKGKYERIND